MSPLEQRFALAYSFCQTVLNLHDCGWVHKSIRSRNVILVPAITDKTEDTPIGDCLVFRHYLKGFEFSRPDHWRSSGISQFDPNTNLYRRPNRQDVPTKLSTKEHDLYAVGVVLLDICLWKTVTNVFESRIAKARLHESFLNPIEIRVKLLGLARKHLPIEMGTRYAQAVQKRLSGEFGIFEDDKKQTNLALAFRHQFLDLLVAGSEL